MSNLIIVGTQWGDEGKGKIVDLLASSADAVVRFQGGHNAGHTLVIDSTTFKLSLLPVIQSPKKPSPIPAAFHLFQGNAPTTAPPKAPGIPPFLYPL